MSSLKRWRWPFAGGLAGSVFLTGLYLVIVSLAESPQHATQLLWEDRLVVGPMILGFGVQTGLYIILKKRLFVPVGNTGLSGALTGASGATSTVAMVACCAHHVADVLPVLGLTAAATFLADYRDLFMFLGLGMTVFGIAFMLIVLFRERRRALAMLQTAAEAV